MIAQTEYLTKFRATEVSAGIAPEALQNIGVKMPGIIDDDSSPVIPFLINNRNNPKKPGMRNNAPKML